MSMRKLILIVLLAMTVGLIPTPSRAENVEVQTGFHYDWWRDTVDNTGRQFYIPVTVLGRHQDFLVRMIGGFMYTAFNPGEPNIFNPEASDRSLSQALDTKLNLSYQIVEKLPVDVLLGLDFNLPTGKTDLSTRDLNLIMDPDLISITQLGQGFNVNPTLTFAKEFMKNWVAGVGLGYLWQGEYDYSTDIQDYNPGNIFSVTPEIRYFLSDNWNFRLFGNYSNYAKDEVEGEDFAQEGDFWLIGLAAHYLQTRWDASANLRTILRAKTRFRQPEDDFALVTERDNNHGDEWLADLMFRYFLNDKTTIKSVLHLERIDANDYPSSSPFHIGRRDLAALQVGLARVLQPNLEGELFVRGLTMHEGVDLLYYHPDSERSYTGASAEFKITGRF